MIVAITGANGFIGRHLVRRFSADGWTVHPVIRRDFNDGLLDERLRGADVVVHAAGATRAPSVRVLRESNVERTSAVAESCRRQGIQKLVFISSQAAAGPSPSVDSPVTESSPPAPIEAYGRTKLDAEAVVAASNVPCVIVRPAAVYGPGDRDFVDLFRLAARGIAIHPGNREQWISIIHVTDLVNGIVRAATNADALGETFFLANDRPVQWRELFRQAAACAQRTLAVDVQIPLPLVKAGAMVGDILAKVTRHTPLLTSAKVALGVPPYWICSNEKARRSIGFAPAISLQAGVTETYHWYRAERWL